MKTLAANAKLLFLYLITNPHTHASGIYVLNLNYACNDTGFPRNTLLTNLDTLSKFGFCSFDPVASVVWVHKMLGYQGRGEKNLRSAAYHLHEDLHGSPLCEDFLAAYPAVRKYLSPQFKEKRQSIPNALRIKILDRDGYRCKKCGATAEEASLEVDHKTPKSKGGTDDEANLETLCQPCNLGKSDRVSEVGTPSSRSPFLNPDTRNLIPETQRLAHGEHGHALLTPDEFLKLKEKLNSHAEDFIQQFDNWVHEAPEAKHAGVKRKDRNPYASICQWYARAVKEGRIRPSNQARGSPGMPTEEEIERERIAQFGGRRK